MREIKYCMKKNYKFLASVIVNATCKIENNNILASEFMDDIYIIKFYKYLRQQNIL